MVYGLLSPITSPGSIIAIKGGIRSSCHAITGFLHPYITMIIAWAPFVIVIVISCGYFITNMSYFRHGFPDSENGTLWFQPQLRILLYWFRDASSVVSCQCMLQSISSNGNIFRVTGPLCVEFTGQQWIPLTKASDAELSCFLWSTTE